MGKSHSSNDQSRSRRGRCRRGTKNVVFVLVLMLEANMLCVGVVDREDDDDGVLSTAVSVALEGRDDFRLMGFA
jgi:hypothetical protein